MPNKAAIVRTFEINAERATYTNKFATLIEKLRALGLADERVLDLYTEVLKSRKGKLNTDFTKLIWGEDESKIAVPEAIKSFKEVMVACRGLSPLSFIAQYTAFVNANQYDVELENGIVGDEFFRLTGTEDHFLIIDPHPLFIERCLREKNKTTISFSFSDDRYVQILQTTKENEMYVSLEGIQEEKYDRVLYFARNANAENIKNMLERIKCALVPLRKSTIHIFLPTTYLEREEKFKDYLAERFTVNKITLFGRDLVAVRPVKKSLVILNNAPSGKNAEILIQKTRRKGKKIIAFLEFRRVKFEAFIRCNRTLSELYDTDYIDYAVPKSRNRAEDYRFTNEVSIYVSVTEDEKRGFRPQYSIYEYPTTEQRRKKVLPRGKLIQRLRGRWFPTREEAVASTEYLLLNNKELAGKVRKIIKERYCKEPISLKSQVFLHLDELEKRKEYDEKFIQSLFFRPNSAMLPLSSLSVGTATAEDIQKVVDETVSELELSETKKTLLWKTVDLLLSYAVDVDRYKRIPVTGLLKDISHAQKNKKAARHNMALPSFSEDQEHQFLQIVMPKCNSPVYLMMLVKYFTGQALNLLRALKVEDFVLNEKLNMYQLAITKTCRARDQETYQLPKAKERFFPVPAMIADMINVYLRARKARSSQRLFAFAETPNKPISEKQFWRAFNKILNQLDMSEYRISIADGDNVPEQTDIDAYGGDLLRENFVFHAKEYALMNMGDVETLLGAYPKDTGRRYYLAYKDPYVQLALRTMLDRWVARLMLPDKAKCTVEETKDEYIIKGVPTKTKAELIVEINVGFDPNNYDNSAINELILSLYAEYGAAVSIEFVEET